MCSEQWHACRIDFAQTRQGRKQRDADGNTIATSGLDLNERVLPGLQRMRDRMSQGVAGGPGAQAWPGNGSKFFFSSVSGRRRFSRLTRLIPGMPGIPGVPGALPGRAACRRHRDRLAPAISHFPDISAISAGAGVTAVDGVASQGGEGFQNFVHGLFKQDRRGRERPSPTRRGWRAQRKSPQPGSDALVARLSQYQQQAALGHSIDDQISPAQNQLFALGEQLGADQVTKLERVAIDVVAMLFELILNDEQIPEALREQIGRLQIPFLKAALLTPDMLRQTEHPARQLVNRMGSAAVALDLGTPLGLRVGQEITRIVNRILEEFGEDVSIFSIPSPTSNAF